VVSLKLISTKPRCHRQWRIRAGSLPSPTFKFVPAPLPRGKADVGLCLPCRSEGKRRRLMTSVVKVFRNPMNPYTTAAMLVLSLRRYIATTLLPLKMATATEVEDDITITGRYLLQHSASHDFVMVLVLVLLTSRCRQHTSPFREHDSTTIGLLFDGPRATLTYFKDGVCLGPAFTGIDTNQKLYPAICSTGLYYSTVAAHSSTGEHQRGHFCKFTSTSVNYSCSPTVHRL